MSGSTWKWIGGTINVDSSSDWTLTAGPGNPIGIPQAGDTAINSGTLVGYGLIAAALINNGTVEASNNAVPSSSTGGDLVIQGAVSGTGSITIAPGATLQIDGSLGADQTIAFSPGAPEKLILGSPAAITANNISGFALGDQVEFSNGVTVTGGAVVNDGTTSVPYRNADGTTGTYQFTDLSYAAGTATTFEYGLDFATGAQDVALTEFFTWTGATSTTFGVANNWSDATDTVPGALDFVRFSSSGGTISGSGSVFVLDFRGVGSWTLAPGTTLSAIEAVQLGRNGTGSTSLSVGTSTTISSAGFIDVANSPGNDDLLSITGGGVVRETAPGVTYTHAMNIGNAGASGTLAPADGIVLVSGAGSRLDLGANGLTVGGNGGTGVLTVQQGGTVNAASANSNLSSSVSIANSAGNGSVLVTGAGSVLNATGYFLDGRGGTGSLTVQNSGSVVVDDAQLNGSGIGIGAGRGAGPSSAATLGGDGIAVVTSDGLLDLNSATSGITVGGDGVNGALTVNSAGTVLAGTGITVGTATTASGTIYGGTGELNIGAGGVVRVNNPIAANGYDVYIGSANSSIGTSTTGTATGADSGQAIVSGAGALLNANGLGIAVGWLSNGSLMVSQGGTVLAGSPNETLGNALSIGRRSTGSVTVTDPGSNITAKGVVYVARAGDGSLTIENHGTLASLADPNGVAGISVGGTGLGVGISNGVTYLITGGSGSALVTADGYMSSLQTIKVGTDGTDGTLTVDQGGTAEAGTQIIIGNSVSVAAGDTIINPVGSIISSGTLIGTTGVLNVGPGGVLKADGSGVPPGTPTMVIGADARSVGELNVTGAGALVTNNGSFVVGSSGQGSLLVQGGASVVTSAGATIAASAGSDGSEASVAGAGSDWRIAGALSVGNAAEGLLNITAGATVTATTLDLGSQSGSAGIVTVSGDNSTLVTIGSLAVGDAGAGELSILNGADVTIGGNLDIGLAGGSGNIDIDGTSGDLTVDGNIVVGTGAAVLTIGPNAILTQDNGGVIAGPNFVVNLYGNEDPPDPGMATYNVTGTKTTDYTAYVDGATFNVLPSAVFTLQTPVIYGSTSFNLGQNGDSSGAELIVNAGSFGSASSVTFNDPLSTLVIGIDQLATIDVPASGNGPFTPEANPNQGQLLIGEFNGTIKDFQAGDTIVVHTSVAATFVQNGSIVSVIGNGGTLGLLRFDNAADAQVAATTPGALVGQAPCFAAGTRIATARGEVAVEALRVGDLVQTVLGEIDAPIVWTGRRDVDCARHPKPKQVWPVRVAAGAFGPAQPHTDLWLSPDHSVYVNEVLIPIRYLVNGSTITQVPVDRVTYHHIELPQHDVVLAEGLPAESFLDIKDGSNYANRPGPVRLYPDYTARMWEAFGCARLVVTGPELAAVRALVGGFAEAQAA